MKYVLIKILENIQRIPRFYDLTLNDVILFITGGYGLKLSIGHDLVSRSDVSGEWYGCYLCHFISFISVS